MFCLRFDLRRPVGTRESNRRLLTEDSSAQSEVRNCDVLDLGSERADALEVAFRPGKVVLVGGHGIGSGNDRLFAASELMIEDGGEGRFFIRIGSKCRCRDDEGQ